MASLKRRGEEEDEGREGGCGGDGVCRRGRF